MSGVLDLPLDGTERVGGATTLRECLSNMLIDLVLEREGFNSKRPYGYSSWIYDFYKPLVKAGLVEGSFDEDGYLESVDNQTADSILVEAIRELFEVDAS